MLSSFWDALWKKEQEFHESAKGKLSRDHHLAGLCGLVEGGQTPIG